MSKTTTIAEIKQLPLDAWVNGTFQALVTDVTPADGKNSAKCNLVDPQDHSSTIQGTTWDIDLQRYEGMIVSFYGSLKRKEFKNVAQVAINKGAKLSIVSSAGGSGNPAGVAGVHMPKPTQTVTTARNNVTVQTSVSPINVQEELGKIAALALLCMEKAQLVKSMNGSFSAQFYENLAMNMNIDAQRKGLQNHLPSVQVKPTDLKQVVVPVQSEEDPF